MKNLNQNMVFLRWIYHRFFFTNSSIAKVWNLNRPSMCALRKKESLKLTTLSGLFCTTLTKWAKSLQSSSTMSREVTIRESAENRWGLLRILILAAVCFIDLGKLNRIIITLLWSKSVKQTVFRKMFITSAMFNMGLAQAEADNSIWIAGHIRKELYWASTLFLWG